MIATEAEARGHLGSNRPSARAQAAQWFASNAMPAHATILLEALEREVVGQIRLSLETALARSNSTSVALRESERDNDGNPDDQAATIEILDRIAGLIRHETEPAIGWVRRAAASEVLGFENSATKTQIEILRSRLHGLETLVAAHRTPRRSRVRLSELVRETSSASFSSHHVQVGVASGADEIETDPDLFLLILSNAIRNAQEAANKLGASAPPVLVETSLTPTQFSVIVTNRFAGDSFNFEHVANSGASSKQDHKGLGLTAMRLASERLGYTLKLDAVAGTAVLALTGQRHA